jgi:hypothetical protein
MRLFRQFGVLVLLLVSCLAPTMACMVPNAAMSTEERACCRTITNQCGQMEMPASHGCCQETPPSIHDKALDTMTVTLHPVAIFNIWLTPSELLASSSAVPGLIEYPDYPPPNSALSAISVLRI